MTELEDALERAKERGKKFLAELKDLNRDEQIDLLAKQIYVNVCLDPYGYPNGLPYWEELIEIDSHHSLGIDKERFRDAAKSMLMLIPYMEIDKKCDIF